MFDFCTDLFSSSPRDAGPILASIKRVVTSDHNAMLLADFTADEVRSVLFSMHPDKSLGLDGLNPGFFQKF